MSHALTLAQLQPNIIIVNGPDRGTKLMLPNDRPLVIGRAKECEIVLNDKKCSRNQARINFEQNRITISNLSEKVPLVVDGKRVKKTLLNEGSIIQIGDTELRFGLESSPQVPAPFPSAQVHTPPSPLPETGFAPMPPPQVFSATPGMDLHSQNPPKVRVRKKKSSATFYFLLLGIVALAGWLFTSHPNPKTEVPIRTLQQQEGETEATRSQIDLIKQQRAHTGKNTRQYFDANALYTQGFRAYQNGAYDESIELFTACLNLYPQHQMAEVYRKKAKQKRDELIQYYMIRGRQYHDQNKFDFCISYLRNVLVMVHDQQSAIFQEAHQMKIECELRLEGGY